MGEEEKLRKEKKGGGDIEKEIKDYTWMITYDVIGRDLKNKVERGGGERGQKINRDYKE